MHLPLPWLLASIAARTAIILGCLMLGIRIFGRRGVGDMNLVDVVLVLLLGNAVQNALTYGSGSLAVGLVSAATLLVIDYLMGVVLARHPELEEAVSGEPTVILSHGRLDRQAMRREGVSEEEVMAAMRSTGLVDLSRVRLGVLEDDGTISIVPEEDEDAGG